MVKNYKVSKNVSKEPSLVIYEQLMLTPGIWNGVKFTKDQIVFGINNTDWSDPENFALIDYHPKKGEVPNSMAWQGYFEDIEYKTLEEGVDKEGMYGSLYIYDPILASKILSKKSPFAVSIDASYSYSDYGAQRLSFTNTALVYRPGCKDAYIQLEDNGDNHKMRIICEKDVSVDDEEEIKSVKLSYDLEADKVVQVYNKENELLFEGSVLSFSKNTENVIVSIMNENDEIKEFLINDFLFFPIMPRMVVPVEESMEDCTENCTELEEVELVKVTDMEAERKRRGMTVGKFYAVPRDPPSESKLPIFDKSHTQNAMARFNQTNFKSTEEKAKAKRKIITAANKFGIEVKEFTKQEETQLSDINIDERGLKKIEDKMNSKNNESLDARISLIEEKLEEINLKLSEKVEEPKEEDVSEDKSEETEESEKVEEVESEKTKLEESSESKEETKSEEPEKAKEVEESKEEAEEPKEEKEQVQEEAIEKLKSKVSELEAKLAEKDEAKEEPKKEVEKEVELEEKTVAKSKTSVQLEGSDDEKSEEKEKIQLSKTDTILARLNKQIIEQNV